jgi:hypothetical protein
VTAGTGQVSALIAEHGVDVIVHFAASIVVGTGQFGKSFGSQRFTEIQKFYNSAVIRPGGSCPSAIDSAWLLSGP